MRQREGRRRKEVRMRTRLSRMTSSVSSTSGRVGMRPTSAGSHSRSGANSHPSTVICNIFLVASSLSRL